MEYDKPLDCRANKIVAELPDEAIARKIADEIGCKLQCYRGEKWYAQVNKILRPGGVFMIVNESDGTDEASLKYEKMIESALRSAGFSEIVSYHHESKPWITVIAYK